jgi:hypothetical protein
MLRRVMNKLTIFQQKLIGLACVYIVLLAAYIPTLQTILNGSSRSYMIDVGETQIVLNKWGTLHATGYPLYVITGNVLTGIMRVVGIDPVVAASLVSLIWGLAALGLVYLLAVHLTERVALSAGMVILLGLTRTLWIHTVSAEIYSFTLAILVGLLILALWRGEIRGRIYWLALLGGIGVAHHRAIAMAIPALIFAVYPYLLANRRRLPRLLGVSLFLGLPGFLQYAYLYARAVAGADWVYGQPDTLHGLWDEFMGKEAAYFIGAPKSWSGLVDNFHSVNDVLLHDLTIPGIIVGGLGLLVAIATPAQRRAGITMFLLAGTSYAAHVFFVYTDVLSAMILPIVVGMAFGWLFVGDWLCSAKFSGVFQESPRIQYGLIELIAVIFAIGLVSQNYDFIHGLTHDETGLQTVEQVREAPEGSTVTLAWGPRYFAVAGAQELHDDLAHIEVVDDRADFRSIVEGSKLLTPDYSLFRQPVSWWEERLGEPVYSRAGAPFLVEIGVEPELADSPPEGVTVAEEAAICNEEGLTLAVTWQTDETPEQDWRVFVHALDSDGNLIAQGDQPAPVFGWRPMTSWLPHERVRDLYPIAVDAVDGVDSIQYGFYIALPEGGFENFAEYEIDVDCRS